eukprot:COSAG01_NODE_1194_length_11305_cov_4.495806_11_plen_61_part_00
MGRYPPQAAHVVLQATLLLLGHKPKKTEEWGACRKLIGDEQVSRLLGRVGLGRIPGVGVV